MNPPPHSGSPALARAGTTASAVTWTVRDLGTLGGRSSEANAINTAGVVVGISNVAGSEQPHAFVWRNGVMRDLGTLAGGQSEATAINDDGIVVGWSRVASGDMRAVRWKDGRKRNLGTLGGRNSEARGINAFGVIVGWSETASGARHAFLWSNGVMRDLGTLGGTMSQANAINRSGTVVGVSTTASGVRHAFRWKDGVFKDLGAMGRQFSYASAINTRGQIVGGLGPFPDAVGEELEMTDGFLYYREVMRYLPVGVGRLEPLGPGLGVLHHVLVERVAGRAVDHQHPPAVQDDSPGQRQPQEVLPLVPRQRGPLVRAADPGQVAIAALAADRHVLGDPVVMVAPDRVVRVLHRPPDAR